MRVPHAARLPHVQEPAAKPDVARHEALARDILEIHSDFLMAVYGYRKVHAQLLAQGWDPAEVGRDQVMNIMRGLGIRGVRRGKTPVFLVKSVFRVSSLIFFGFRHEECRPVVCFTGCPSCRT